MPEPKGLFDKYILFHADGRKVDPEGHYFVLRLDTDLHAREATRAYADSLEESGENPELVSDLRNWLSVLTRRKREGG